MSRGGPTRQPRLPIAVAADRAVSRRLRQRTLPVAEAPQLTDAENRRGKSAIAWPLEPVADRPQRPVFIFRYDDYSAAQETSVEIEEQLFDIFRTHRQPLTVGVTPWMAEDVHDARCRTFADFGRDERRLELLRRALDDGWEVALHGLTHRRSAVREGTEFALVSRRLQSEWMARGRDALSRCLPEAPLRTFIPPWNSYDATTVEVAALHGFDVLCAGDNVQPRVQAGVRIIPSVMTGHELITYLRMLSVRQLLTDLRRSTIVVTFHEYEFRIGNRPDRARLGALEGAVAGLAAEGVGFETVSRAQTAACGLADGADFRSALEMVRRLNHPCYGRAMSPLEQVTGAAGRRAVGQLFRATASALATWRDTKRRAEERLAPARQSLARARAMAVGRLRRGPQHTCFICGYAGVFSPFGGRPHAGCPGCGSLERHRFIAAAVGPLLAGRTQRRRALMVAPDPLFPTLRAAFDQVVTADVAAPNAAVRLDLRRLPFRSRSLDLVLAVHVLDEIEDDAAALRECWRVLAPGGWLIAPVPILEKGDTRELDERRQDGKIRLAGRDYFDRVEAHGFRRVAAFDPWDERYAELHRRHNVRAADGAPGFQSVVVFEVNTAGSFAVRTR